MTGEGTRIEGPPSERSPLLGGSRSESEATVRGHENGDNSAASPARSPDDDNGKPQVAANVYLFFAAVSVGIFLMSIDQLLTVASYAKIGNELNALNNTSWIATSYYLTLTSFQPLYGKLSDIFGRKECLLFSYAVFGLGCVGCGLAQNIVQLCVARAISGIGGGGMTAVVSILVTDLVPLRDRGMWQGYLNIVACTGTSIGGPLGGFLAESVGWRWSFLAQGPMCAVAWVAVYFIIHTPQKTKTHMLAKIRQVDFLGAFTLVASVVALLVGLDCGSNLGWGHTTTIVSLAITPPLVGFFIFVEKKIASHPFAPGHVILNPALLPCYLCNFLAFGAYMAVLFFVPLFFQAVQGANAMVSGAFLTPAMLAVMTASIGGGYVVKKTGKFYWITVFSLLISVLAYIPSVLSVWFKSSVGQMVGLFFLSFGASSVVTTTLVGLIANAATADMAIAVACSYLFRSLGTSMAISLSSAALQQVLRMQLASRFPNGDEARMIEEKVRQNLDYIKKLSSHQAEQVRASYQMATLGGFAPTFVFMAAGLLVSFWIREKPLKR